MTTPGGQDNNTWAGNTWLPTANKPGGTGLGAFGNRTKDDWGEQVLGIFGDSAPKVLAIGEGLLTNWIGAAGDPDDPLTQESADRNLLTNGGLDSSTSWTFPTGGSWDATVGRTVLGSAMIVCDGTVQSLVSSPVTVVEGQLLLLGAYAQWDSISGAVEASLVLQCFTGATLILEQELAAFTPAGAGGWKELQQAFTAPAGCDSVRLVCEIEAASGTLWWDDVSVRKRITDLADEVRRLVSAVVSALTGDFDPFIALVGEIPILGELDLDGLLAAFKGTYAGADSALLAIKSLAPMWSGLIDPSRIPQLSLSQLTAQPGPNLLTGFGDFADGDTMDGGGVWTWDGAVGHTSAGSARTVGDGTRHVLTSELVAVAEGQALECSGRVRWSGATGAGSVAQLVVIPYIGGVAQPEIVVDDVVDPAASSGGVFVALSGAPVVAVDVTHFRVRITVEAALTAGTVWWDDVVLRKTATSIAQQWITGLPDALTDLWQNLDALVSFALDGLGVTPIGSVWDKILDLGDELGDLLGSTETNAANISDLIAGLLANPAALLGALPQAKITNLVTDLGTLNTMLAQLGDIFDGLGVTPINTVVQKVKDFFTSLTGWQSAARSDIDTTASGIVDGWAGTGSSTGDVYDTMAAIKSALLNGYTVDTITSSTTWTKPSDITELMVVAVGGGRTGTAGSTSTSNAALAGGAGGLGGGFLAQALDPTAVSSSVAVTIGGPGQDTSFGSYVSTTAGAGGIATQFGYSATSSLPGKGGNGGGAGSGAEAAVAGDASALAAGGTSGGATSSGNGTATSGGPGGNVSTSAPTKCGGGGGGGGAGRNGTGPAQTYRGGTGGAGGYPGGGGGGGGSASGGYSGAQAGPGGAGANGVMWIFTR